MVREIEKADEMETGEKLPKVTVRLKGGGKR